MNAGAQSPILKKSELFERLALGRSAAVTVVTPNKRLSQALMLEFDAFQIEKALSIWEAPDILPFGAFVQRLYEDGLYADLSAALPMLLTPAQEEELWKQVVSGSGLLDVEGAATKCRDTWNLANPWRIHPGAGNQDTEAFARWLTHYKKKTENDLDTARLPDALRPFLPELKRPKLVVAYAFDILPPQTKEFLDALGTEIAFCRPDPRSGSVSRAAFDSAKHEIEAAAQTQLLRARLEKLYALRETGLFSQKTPAEWARHFSSVLEAAGFPGERALDSDEFQTQAKWHEALGELSRLDRISKEMSFSQAFQTLRKICADTLFQPETPDTPIQVLGLLESAGVEFDHLWVTGLTDEAWPLKSSPNPFLPLAQQRKAGIPEASAETSLALDRRITDGWNQAPGEVGFSHFTKEEDRDVLPSPLIADLPEKAVEIPAFPQIRDLIFASRDREPLEDRVAPAVREKQVRGGTRVLSDQAACPFRP